MTPTFSPCLAQGRHLSWGATRLSGYETVWLALCSPELPFACYLPPQARPDDDGKTAMGRAGTDSATHKHVGAQSGLTRLKTRRAKRLNTPEEGAVFFRGKRTL